MNVNSDTTAASDAATADGIATVGQLAAMDFQPWPPKPADPKKVSLELKLLRMIFDHAERSMQKSKPELMAEIEGWSEKRGRLIFEGYVQATGFLKGALTLIEAAEARILCAGATLEGEGEE